MASGGGFMVDPLLSPPPSSVASQSTATATLPHPRASPLRPGGAKQSALVRFLDQGLLKIERRFAKRGEAAEKLDKDADEASRGYKSFAQLEQDVEKLFELIWVSGTPSVQIPYLLTLAYRVSVYLPGFEAEDSSPKAMFRLLDRFDIAFASLLTGRHVETGEELPGFGFGSKGVSGTEKVRMKSIVERTRVVVAEVVGRDGGDEDGEDGGRVQDVTDLETGDEMDTDDSEDEDDGRMGIEMGVARVYDSTVVELGDTIGNTPIGIITDE